MDKSKRIHAIQEMIEGVLLAIPTEISAREAYLGIARRSENEDTRKLFESLAGQERGHEAELRRILASLQEELRELKSGI